MKKLWTIHVSFYLKLPWTHSLSFLLWFIFLHQTFYPLNFVFVSYLLLLCTLVGRDLFLITVLFCGLQQCLMYNEKLPKYLMQESMQPSHAAAVFSIMGSLPSVCFRLVHMEYRSWCCNSSYSKPRIVFRMTAVLSISHFNAICCLSACAFLVLFLIKTLISLRKRSLLPSPTYPLYLTWYLKVLKKCLYNKGVAVYI